MAETNNYPDLTETQWEGLGNDFVHDYDFDNLPNPLPIDFYLQALRDMIIEANDWKDPRMNRSLWVLETLSKNTVLDYYKKVTLRENDIYNGTVVVNINVDGDLIFDEISVEN